MKNNITKIISILSGLLISECAWSYPSVSSFISDNRSSLALTISNASQSKFFCENINVSIQMAGTEFNDVVGTVDLNLGPVFLDANESMDLNQVGSAEMDRFMQPARPIILTAQASASQCRLPRFADYCAHAKKSDEETYTLNKILDQARTSDCNFVEARVKRSLDLANKNIVDVRPIHLLSQLRRIDISNNPIENIDPLLTLPKIKVIVANDTLVRELGGKKSSSLKRIELEGTPYAKEK